VEDNINVFQVLTKLLGSVKGASLVIVIFIGAISFILQSKKYFKRCTNACAMICLLSLIIQKKKEKLYTPETVKEDIAL
jgi:hypothetical protein